MPQTHIYAVITGDIVDSTSLTRTTLARVRETLTGTIRAFAKQNADVISHSPSFFRGDSWQVLLHDPRIALKVALLVRAQLHAEDGVDTRASIGVGTVAGLEKDVAISTGEAFTLSGRALENIPNFALLTGALPERTASLAPWFPTVLHLCSGLTDSWTRRQAEVFGKWLSLVSPTHESIAAALKPPVTQQSVTDTLTSANWRYLYEAMKLFYATDWQGVCAIHDDAGRSKQNDRKRSPAVMRKEAKT